MTDVVIAITKDADEFWSEIMGGEPWIYLEWYKAVKYEKGTDWDKHGRIKLEMEDPNDEDKTIKKTLDVGDLAKAFADLSQQGWHHCNGASLDNYDLCTSDAVIQQAFYGELVYG